MGKRSNKAFVMWMAIFATLTVCAVLATAGERDTFLTPTKIKRVRVEPMAKKMRPLRVITFNIAHGSTNMFGIVPLFRKSSTIRKRLRKIADFLRKEKPDVVGFQEADGPSWWSGRFHHVNYIAEFAGYPFSILGIHVKTKRKRYGTALISRLPMSNALSHRFKPLTMFKKGFVVATVQWPGRKDLKVDIVSLHLDPRKRNVQAAQLQEVVNLLRLRKRPIIVMGDFNTVWFGKKPPLDVLRKQLKLRTYKLYNPYLYTHRFPRKRRIDWIFISPELAFVRHRILKVKLTDHFPVVADIRYRNDKAKNPVVKNPVVKNPVVKNPSSRPSSRPIH